MGKILCFSDLHLGEPTQGQVIGDFKVPLGDKGEHPTTQDVVERTLRDVCDAADPFDGVIIAGDLTNKCADDGFEAFAKLMDELATCVSKPENVVVVPGNHDVPYQSLPSSLPRYDRFLSVTRDRGYSTPLLDGLDFEARGGHREKDFDRAGPHVVESEDFVIVPINSSNWCHFVAPLSQGAEEEWKVLISAAKADLQDSIRNQLQKTQTFDLARISPEQIDALKGHLEEKGLTGGGDDRVRIAVLHHHLLPVSTEEEVKSFESLTNLAAVRQFLHGAGFHVVFHGHKHHPTMYWDADHRRGSVLSDPLRRMFVISAPGHFTPGGPSVRILETGGLPRARVTTVTTVLGAEAGQQAVRDTPLTVPLWVAEMESSDPPWTTLSGPTTRVVYERARVLFESNNKKQFRDLLCIVDGPKGANQLPDAYPDTGHADPQKWFDDLVSWWQLPSSVIIGIGVRDFNHGERIYPGDKIGSGVEVLIGDPTSSRALIQVVRPDETCRGGVEFPAFTSVHLRLVEIGPDRYRLDCVGWFRKQEMRYWWPVNIRELAIIQEKALKRFENRLDVQPGRLATYASIAVYGKELPLLAVAEVDRLLDEPEALWRLAKVLAFPSMAETEDVDTWRRILQELEPQEQLIIPELGLSEIAENVQRLMDVAPGLERVMRDLGGAIQAFEIAGADDIRQGTKRAKVGEAVMALQESVRMRLEGSTSEPVEGETSETASEGIEPGQEGQIPESDIPQE